MAKKLKIWYDKEADFLEVMFSDEPGYMRESEDDDLLERVNQKGKIIGYSILGISRKSNLNPIYKELEMA